MFHSLLLPLSLAGNSIMNSELCSSLLNSVWNAKFSNPTKICSFSLTFLQLLASSNLRTVTPLIFLEKLYYLKSSKLLKRQEINTPFVLLYMTSLKGHIDKKSIWLVHYTSSAGRKYQVANFSCWNEAIQFQITLSVLQLVPFSYLNRLIIIKQTQIFP